MKKPMQCYVEIERKCKTVGYEPPSYNTVLTRFKQKKAGVRQGTQGKLMDSEISRDIIGELPRGDYPLDFVQFDEHKLRVYLIDKVDKEERRKKPYLLLGIDAKTRMVFTWALSFNRANSVTVNRALMRGFLPKEVLFEKMGIESAYPIYGIPRRLQFDNAKYFDTKYVKEFCVRQCVEDTQFRMAYRPDLGGFVERVFRTVEGFLVDLPGYDPKAKKIGHNPRKTAPMTLHQFEKWFVNRTIIYHNTPHGGLKEDIGKTITPLSMYYEEMEGRTPRLPENLDLMEKEVFKFELRKLSHRGISIFNSRYNNDGNRKCLQDIRRRNRGETKTVTVYWDPDDIGFIWVFDEEKRRYIPVEVSTGLLAKFRKKHPNIPIKYFEYVKINKQLNEEGMEGLFQVDEICRRLEEVNSELVQQSLKEKRKHHHKQKYSKYVEKDFKVSKEEDEENHIEERSKSFVKESQIVSISPKINRTDDPYKSVKIYVNEILEKTDKEDEFYKRFKMNSKYMNRLSVEEDKSSNEKSLDDKKKKKKLK